MTLTVADIVEAVGGRLLSGDGKAVVPGLSIDTRTLEAGDLYIAIRGERFDGHAFVEAALAGGACGAVVSQPVGHLPPVVVSGRALIVVPDTTGALQRLARWVRRQSGARVVVITGSVGKTTTKDVTAAFLGLRHRVMRSSGNLNNHIGLPLSLLELRHGADVAVVELGMNHAGEISRLVAIADPDVRVWTNVAEVHIEFFASIDAIADAKAEVLEGATATTVLVANADDPRVMSRAGGFPGRVLTFGTAPGSTVTASEVEDLGIDGMTARVSTGAGSVRVQVPLLGRGNLQNVLAAVAVAQEFGVGLADIAGRATTLGPASHRGDVIRLGGGVTVVDDAYNSNPRALQGALRSDGQRAEIHPPRRRSGRDARTGRTGRFAARARWSRTAPPVAHWLHPTGPDDLPPRCRSAPKKNRTLRSAAIACLQMALRSWRSRPGLIREKAGRSWWSFPRAIFNARIAAIFLSTSPRR